MGTSRATIYVYEPQRRAVLSDLRPLLECGAPPDIRPVDDLGHQIQGIRGGCFVNLSTHPDQPPQRVWDMLRAMGFAVMTIDDTWMRGAAQDRVRHLTEGMTVKGGRNQGQSQITERPTPPAPFIRADGRDAPR